MNTYQYLDNLICGYFNQDSDLDGDTMNAIVNEYKSTHSEEQTDQLINDIQSFMADATDNIEKIFMEKYGFDVDPALWEHTAISFLEEVLRLLRS